MARNNFYFTYLLAYQ